MSFIEIKDIVKNYGDKRSVDHLNLTIERGEVFGLLGPNGAGKSTTIKMICGLLASDQGEISIDGLSVKKHPLEVKRRIGIVPQELAIYENLSARENLVFFGKLYGLRGRELANRVDEALAFVGLADRQKDKPGSFSGGMKRRLNIACAVVHEPKLIIMDEPTVGIDPQSRNHILESVRLLNQNGTTVIYTSHYMEEVEAISSRIGIIDHGQLIAQGQLKDLIAQVEEKEKLQIETEHMTDAAEQEIERHPSVKRLNRDHDMLEIYLDHSQAYLQDILFILSKHDVRIVSLRSIEPDLESLFLTLTGRTLRD